MIEKDFRALLPLWLVSLAAVAFSHAAGLNWEWLGVTAYFLGAPAIGALAFGHEYTHRTMGMLLTLPVPRSRIWLSKMLVASVLVAVLTAVEMVFGPLRGSSGAVEIALFSQTTLAGICLATWFTMLARNPLAGTVFSASLGGVMLLLGAWIGINLYGDTKQVTDFQVVFMWSTLVPFCVMGLVLGWHTFVNLEAIEGPGAAIELGLQRSAAPATATLSRRHPLWMLARKELRLQHLAWTLALIYSLVYVGLVLWRRGSADADTLAQALTMLFAGAIAIVLGAVTTAEERQLGTHDAQLLQPIPAWQRWFVKAGMAFAAGAVLTIALPVLLATILPSEHMRTFARGGLVQPQLVWLVGFVLAVSIYISALSDTTMRVLMVSIAVLVSAAVFFTRVLMVASDRAWRATHTVEAGRVFWNSWLTRNQELAFWSILFAGLVLLILRLAAANHRNADRGARRIGLQVAAIALTAVAGFALAGALGVR